jgi:hypothetical protein
MMKNLLIFTLLFFTFSSQNAFAYIDPGTGSAIISAIIGFFVVFGVIIKSFFIKDKSNKNNKD